MRALCLLALCGLCAAGPVDEVLFKARHAQLVQGDPEAAIRLYRQALEDTSLDAARQAEIHYRVARCYEELQQYPRALDHLTPHLYTHGKVSPELRQKATAARARIERRLPRVKPPAPPRRDPEEARRERIANELRAARRFLESGDEMRALLHTQRALRLDPQNASARAIDAELEKRLSGVADFIRDPLRFVRKWTDTRITQVAKRAQERLAEGVARAERKEHNLAWASFREAVALIDGCELGRESERLVDLRSRIVARWDAAHRAAFGEPLAGKETEEAPATRSTVLSEFLNRLQGMLDLISSKEREYRILPVQTPRGRAGRGWHSKPPAFRLFRDLASRWSPALFARLYLPLRVQPDSWARRDSYLEAVGGMLVARNRPAVLDALLSEVRQLEQPAPPFLEGRFLIVPVSREAIHRLEKDFGEFEVSHRGPEPVQYRVVPSRFGLDYICSYLRDRGAEVRPGRDTFAAEIANGVPQTFFVGMPLGDAPGYRGFKATGTRSTDRNYGLLIDLYPLKDRTGKTATGMRLSARIPVPPLEPGAPRFLSQESELFVDLPEGATLVVAGLVDPFARGEGELLLLWQYLEAAAAGNEKPAGASPLGAEVPLRNLLLRQRDFPGPRATETRGFVRRDRLEVLTERARFLEAFLRRELGTDEVAVRVEEAVARVPPALREDAAQIVAAMERESRHSYIVEVHTRAVRTPVLARWLKRNGLRLTKLQGAEVALADAPSAAFLLKGLEPTEPQDVFAPRNAWHKPTALGLQARHVLSARTITSPVYDSEEDLATGDTRTITEGLRITVRPYTWRGNRLRVEVDIQTSALESDEEERALLQAVPSHRTRFSGTRAVGTLDLGNPDAPKTALICRIPHPTASGPDRLVEVVIALSVRRVP